MGIQAATIENQAGFDGMDLLTGSFEGLGRSFSAPLNTLESSQNTHVFSRQHSVGDGAFEPFNVGQPHSGASWIEHPFSTPPKSSKPVAKLVGSLFDEFPVAEAFTIVSLSSAEGATTLYPGARMVSAKLASAVTFSENKPSERTKASWITKGAGVVDLKNLSPSTTSSHSGWWSLGTSRFR
jgi:hypothetical protein